MAEIVPNRVPCGKKVTPTPPQPEPTPVTLCDITGIKYFKLQSQIPGDYTKNCGLLGNEIDENFYFLRSMDIKTAYTIDEEGRKILVLERVNCGREIKVDITDDDAYQFRLEDGYMYITFPDGHEEKIGRFLVEGDNVHIVTDASIQGDGSYGNPIGVDLAYRTGTYAPADFYADLTCTAVTLNDIPPIGYGHAVITKEDVSRFGALYTWDQAHKIDEALAKEGRGWRLPTKEDWAKLLNWAEVNEDEKNHDTDKSGNFGCVAGNRLKSIEFWKTITDPDTKPVDDFGFSIYPVGICPENYNTREPQEYDFTGLYKVTSFWTSSICDGNGEPYVRTFSYGHNDVAQFTENKKKRLSIRLVRDINSDFDITDYAEILGDYVPVKLTTDGKQLWTSINISAFNYDGFNQNEVTIPEEWKDVDTDVPAVAYCQLVQSGDSLVYVWIDEYEIPSTAIVETVEEIPEPTAEAPEYIKYEYTIHFDMLTEAKFFYNAWDGNRWHKKVIKEGESVIILHEDYETGCDTAATPYVTSANTNHEWRLFVDEFTGLDELIDTLEALKGEFQKEFDELNEKIDELSATTEEFSAATVEEIARLDERVSALTIVEVVPSGESAETILRSYQLFEGDTPKGVTIDIPKDKNIKSISTGWSGAVIDEVTGEFTYNPESGDTEVVRVVYQKNDGLFELVEIDIEDFIRENEFKDGLEVVDHTVKVKIDPASDWFLTVSMSGVSLHGVDAAFDNIAKDIIGASGNSKDGYDIDFYDVAWEDPDGMSRDEIAALDPDYMSKTSDIHGTIGELPNAKEWLEANPGKEYLMIHQDVPVLEDRFYKVITSNNYIPADTTIVDAIKTLDMALKAEEDRATTAENLLGQKIDDEIERAMAAEESISGDVTTLSATVESFSAATVAELERLDGQDIADGDYTLTVLEGLTLNRKNGTDTIVIGFDGDYGEFGE